MPLSAASTSLGSKLSGSVSRPIALCWRAGSSSQISGVSSLRLRGIATRTVVRRLAHEPLGWRPTTLEVTIRRYRCTGYGDVWRQDTSRAEEPRAKLSRRGLRWALEGIVVQDLTVARVAEGLAVAWNTGNDAVLAEGGTTSSSGAPQHHRSDVTCPCSSPGRRVLIEDTSRFDGANVIGVDEHVWRHTRKEDKYVTVIVDLTGIRDGAGPARLLDMVEGAAPSRPSSPG